MATSADPIDLAAPPVSDDDAVPLRTRIAMAEPAPPGTMQVDQVDNGVATLTSGPNGEQVIQVPAGSFQEGQTVADPRGGQATPDGVPGRLPQDQLDAIAAGGAYAPPPGVAGAAPVAGEPPIGTANVLGAVVPIQGQPPAGTSTPGAPAAAGPATLPPGSADLEQRIKDTTDASSKAASAVGDAQQQSATDIGQAYADKAELQRQQAIEMAAQQQYVHDRQATLDKEDAAALQQAQQKTIPDFWAGNEGDKVGAAITVALSGAAGALLGSTHNQALEAIQHNVDAYYGREKEKIDNLYKYAEQKGLLDEKTKARYAGELTDLIQQHAYTLASAADRIQQVTAESQGGVDKAKADQMAAALQGQATSELQQARGLDIKRFDSESDRMKAEADQTRAAADMLKAGAYKAKHSGGGGGSGAGMDVEGLAKAVRLGADDGKGGTRPLTYDEQVAAAKQFGVPIEAKAGRVSLKTVLGGTAFDANEGRKNANDARKDSALGQKDEKQINKEAEEWRKGNGINDIEKKQREIGSVLEEIKNAPHNPLQQALAIEKAVSSARGGAASRQALDLALHHLGGKWDSIQAFIQAGKDGEIAPKQMDNFLGFMTTQLGAAQKEGKDAYDNFEKYRASQPPVRAQLLEQARGKIFSGLHGFGGGASAGASAGGASAAPHPSTAAVGATRQGPDGKTYQKVGPNNWQPVTQ